MVSRDGDRTLNRRFSSWPSRRISRCLAKTQCGIISEKFPGMDMVSVGPTIEGVHTPDEKIYIDTVERFWQYLLAILKNVH